MSNHYEGIGTPEELAAEVVRRATRLGGDVEITMRRLPRRVVEIALPAPYDEFSVTAWVNFPKRLARDLTSGEAEAISAALTQIVTAHDLVDEDGQPYPPASDPQFWDEISNDVGAAIIQAVMGQIGKLDPKPPTT